MLCLLCSVMSSSLAKLTGLGLIEDADVLGEGLEVWCRAGNS